MACWKFYVYNNRGGGNTENCQVIFQKSIAHKIGKIKGNGQISG